MRRGRGRGNNYNMGRNADAPGPLMTEHIRNLDMELELLKRKREMMEQQQHLMGNRFDNKRQYIPSLLGPNNHGDSSSNRNYSLMYDNQPAADYIPLSGGGRKRPSEPNWRDNSQPKRFPGPGAKNNPKNAFGAAPTAQPRYFDPNPMPAKARPANQRHRMTTPSFKSKPGAPPNKLASYPLPERKALVAQSVKAVNRNMVLRPDRTPSLQLTGRLELALGHLLKEIKAKYGAIPPYSINFSGQSSIKPMKKLIRERIREVMMGREVGALPDIMAHYRQKYPLETDLDIANEGLAHQTPSDVTLMTKYLRADKTDKYYKECISLMVDQKLYQMLLKLSEIYSKNAPPGETTVELTPVKKVSKKKEETDFSNDVVMESEENSTENKEISGQENVDDPMVKEETVAEENAETVAKGNEETVAKGNEETVAKGNEETVAKDSEVTVVMDEPTEKVNDEGISKDNGVDIPTVVVDDNSEAENDEIPAKEKVVLDRLIEQKLPKILLKHIEFIKSLLDFDQMNEAIKRTPNKKKVPTEPREPRTPAKFFVKIYSRKGLPKKNAMQEFLKPFKPKSVKKHKAMNNLLFVGFDDKESFDKILEQNGTTLGKCTLQITVSENKRDKPNDKADDDDVQIVESSMMLTDPQEIPDSANSSTDDQNILGDLDNQISDLLTSIKNAENTTTPITIDDDNNSQQTNENVENVTENAVNAEPANISNNDQTPDEKGVQNEKITTETNTDSAKPEQTAPTKVLEVIKESENENDGNEGKKTAVDAAKNEAAEKENTTRATARLPATPSTIRTRRASRLAQNN